jgi:hypothetical protein
MLAHGIDIQTMNSLQKHTNLDEYFKSSKKKRKKNLDSLDVDYQKKSKSWLEDAFQAMGQDYAPEIASQHGSEEQEEEQNEASSSEESDKSLESLLDTYNTEEEDAILQYKFEDISEPIDLKQKLKEQKDKY